jgi:hypothetical protein
MKKTLIVALMTALTALTGCGGGGSDQSDSGYFWDGFLEGGTQWRCRDASNGQFIQNMYCSDLKVGDWKWPTAGVPLETNSWYRGVSFEVICKEKMDAYKASKGPFTRVSISNIQMNLNINYQNFWNANNDMEIAWKKDDFNWIVWMIQAPRSLNGIYPAKCVGYVMDNGNFKGLVENVQ